MKEKEQSWQRDYKPLKIYKNDLVDIFNIAKEYEKSDGSKWEREVHVTTDKYELDDITDLDEISSEVIYDLELRVGHILSLGIKPYQAYLRVSDDKNLLAIGIAKKIDDILKNRVKPFFSLPTIGSRTVIGFILCVLFNIIACACIVFEYYYISFPFFILAISSIPSLVYLPYKHSIIIMSNHGERPNFFQRNKEEFLRSIILMIIAAILSVSGTLIVQRLTKKPETKKTVGEVTKQEADTENSISKEKPVEN